MPYIWRGGRAPHGSRQRSRSFGEWLGMELGEYREATNERRSYGMNKRYSDQSAGEQSSHELCWWLTLIAGVVLCLWK